MSIVKVVELVGMFVGIIELAALYYTVDEIAEQQKQMNGDDDNDNDNVSEKPPNSMYS